jgi:hypothetical protein
MAKAMRCQPADVYGLGAGSFEAYAFNSAVVRWGTAFETAVSEATREAKDAQAAQTAQARVLRRWLPSERRYADPAQRGSQL